MKKVSFGITSVQKGRRIILDESLLQNLDIEEGDPVELFLDTKEEAIIVKKPHNISSKTKQSRPRQESTDYK
jgi:bifunctional DNA-binding transcriptional regulator/antitoxin component of YhaV-PrlF toxin-antitoxin module